MNLSPDSLRKRFAEITKKYDAIDAKRTKLQLERDGKVDKVAAPKLDKDYGDKIRKLHAEAAPIEEERAMISRALGGKTS
jgi:hypothetical protein